MGQKSVSYLATFTKRDRTFLVVDFCLYKRHSMFLSYRGMYTFDGVYPPYCNLGLGSTDWFIIPITIIID